MSEAGPTGGAPELQVAPPSEAVPRLGVVIPSLNEDRALPGLLDDLARLPLPVRIVLADGGSADATVQVARSRGVRVVRTPRGRARQMNVGAAALSTPWLLFLHADCRLPAETRRALARWLEDPPHEEAAHFTFRLDAEGPWWSVLEWGQRVRERLTGLVYGDQGLLVSRERWQAVGGIPDLPLMEDVEFARRLRQTGGLRRIDAPVVTSARRYQSEGPLRAWLRNAALITLFGVGVPTRALARFYPPENGRRGSTSPGSSRRNPPSGPTSLVLVFAKAPRPGRVKTRLAADVGSEEAVRIYRAMGRQVVDQLRGGAFRLCVYHAPPEAEPELREWLGTRGLSFRPQASGDLGRRMHRAFEEGFQGADRVCIVGTDAPDVGPALVEEAFACLDHYDVVFGAARDGGYYLVALRRPAPELFREIPWSTPRVLERSLEAAERAGLRATTLRMLSDVDRVDDLPSGLRGGLRSG